MIDRNLGNAERVVRLLMGLAFGGWALSQPSLTAIEWFVVIISLMLMLNGIFFQMLPLVHTRNRY